MVVETTLYERLGVTCDATLDQIRRSYRKAALLWHPDRNQDDPTAAEKFKDCLQAYEILSNPDRRIIYDAYGLSGVLRSAAPAPAPEPAQQPRRPQTQSAHHPPRRSSGFADPMRSGGSQAHTAAGFSPFPFTSPPAASDPAPPPRFSFSSSWSFQASTSSGANGTYSTHYESWNSRDGHQSSSSRGTFRPNGDRIDDVGTSSSRRRRTSVPGVDNNSNNNNNNNIRGSSSNADNNMVNNMGGFFGNSSPFADFASFFHGLDSNFFFPFGVGGVEAPRPGNTGTNNRNGAERSAQQRSRRQQQQQQQQQNWF